MLGYIARRFLTGIVLLFAISTIAFLLLYLGGGDIARKILGENATQEAVVELAQEIGLDRPLPEQYAAWLGKAITGDFGRSWFSGQPVIDAILSRAAVTLSLMTGAVIVVAPLAVILGVLAATHQHGWIDRVTQMFSLIGFALPGFLVAVALVLIFALKLGWFAPTGFTRFSVSPIGWLATVTLPVISLSLRGIANVTQQIRGAVIDIMRNDYLRTLRSRGLSERRVLFKHVLRNAVSPGLSMLEVYFVSLLGGAVIVEKIFAIPGLGQAAVDAALQGDIPIVMGLVIATGTIVVVFNFIVDLLQAWLNPKVRFS
jgi:peptide/nickel transport system permease protein